MRAGSYWTAVAIESPMNGDALGGAVEPPALRRPPSRASGGDEQRRSGRSARTSAVSGQAALAVVRPAVFSASRACMIRSRRSCGLLTPMKLNRSDASSLAVSKSIEPTFMIRSTGDCLTVMFWIRSTFVELSVFERIPRRMLRRFVVIVYCVKNRCDPADAIVSPIPTTRMTPIRTYARCRRPTQSDEQEQAEERRA